MKRNALDAENKLTRFYEAIEAGLTDSNRKGRIAELKRVRDAAQADAERAEGRRRDRIEITPEALEMFAVAAKERMRGEDGSFRRNYVQQLVQRAEVGTDEIRIVGSRARLLQTLVASGGKPGVETAAHCVRSSDLKWLP